MSYEPGRKDLRARTGADNRWAFRFHRRGDPTTVGALVEGDWVVYDDGKGARVWPVASVAVAGSGRTTVKLGNGYVWEPSFTAADTATIPTAPAAEWEAADMRVIVSDAGADAPPVTEAVPTEVDAEDATLLVVTADQTWLEPFQQAMDWTDPAANLTLPYDLHGTFDGAVVPVLTGLLTIVRSAASPDVDDPTPEEE
jgi:hypothetical protein